MFISFFGIEIDKKSGIKTQRLPTPSAILETGFLTTPSDARLLTTTPQIPTRAIAGSIVKFLKPEDGA